MQQAKEVFVLSKYQKSAPQLSVALREGKKRPNQDIVTGLRMMPLVIWYRVPLPADLDSVACGCEVWVHPVSQTGASFWSSWSSESPDPKLHHGWFIASLLVWLLLVH